MKPIASFNKEQFNRIFPFFILIDSDKSIASYGKTLEKLFPDLTGKLFADHFAINRPKLEDLSFKSIQTLTNQIVVLECKNEQKTILRGQIEMFEDAKKLLFIGSPWFGSIKEVTSNNLSLNDFAYHDPMIDLLHVLKTQEITTEDLKHLLETVNKQKNDLRQAAKRIEDIALFPTQNPDPLIRIDLDGNVLQQNPKAELLTHYKYQDNVLTVQQFWSQIAKNLNPDKDRILLEAEANGEIYSFVIIAIKSSGYYNIYGRKVTEEKKKEIQLQILSSIAAENTHGVVIADREGKIEWVNHSFEQMTGYALDEIVGKKPGHVLQGPKTDKDTIKYLSDQIAEGKPFIAEILNYKKDGQTYWLRIQGQALLDKQGKVTKYFAIEEDITAQKEQQKKLEEFEARFRMALEKIGDYVWEHDFKSGITRFSKKENHFIGVDTEQIENNANLWWNCILDEDRELLAENDRLYKSGELDSHVLEYRMRHTDGTIKWVLDRGVVIEKDTDGKPNLIIGTHTDITRQKKLELELGATANRLTSLIQNLYSGVLLEDENQQIGLLNRKFCDLFEITTDPDLLLGRNCDQAHDQAKHLFNDPSAFMDRTLELIQNRKLVINDRLEMKDGKHLNRDFIPIWNGNLYNGHLWLYTDITDQINADQKLEKQRIFYEQILNNIPADIAVFDKEHRYIYSNPKVFDDPELSSWILGKRDEDLVAQRNLSPSIASERQRIFDIAVGTRSLQAFEEEIVRPNGQNEYILRNLYPVLDDQDEVNLVVGYGIDITQLKMSQHQIQASEKRYRDVINNSLALITTHDLEGNFISVNPMVSNIYGYHEQELVGYPIPDFLLKEDQKIFYDEYLPRIKKQKQDSGIFRVKGKMGQVVYTLYHNFLKEEPGMDPYVIGFGVDITERILAEKELKIAKKSTEELAEAKQNFLANMSHEIRTPMNAIIGMSNQMSKTQLSDRQEFYLNTIHTAADNLLVIINDILDLTKIEAGKLSIEEIGFEPKKLVENAIQVLLHKAEEKGIRLRIIRFDPHFSEILIGDPHRLNQVLLNLISNAIKFTERGTVDVDCEVLEDKTDAQLIRIRVCDTGIGMDESFLKNLFQKFSQEDVSVSRKFGGTGLGMTITQSLLQLMGGTINIDSKKGEGTIVSIQIELKKGNKSQLPYEESIFIDKELLSGKKILVVDDNEMNRLVASTILENFEVIILEAEDGRQAINVLEEEWPDIILMDIQMPILNGLEATRLIRESKNDIPIIALTANAIKGENEKCLQYGMNDYISKPYREEVLLTKIIHWLNPEGTYPPKIIELKEKDTDKPIEEQRLYDLAMLEELGGGNQLFVRKMIRLFCDQTPSNVTNMIQAYENGDLEKMGSLAHKMKPSIDSLKISTIQEDIRVIEKAGKEKKRIDQLEQLLFKVQETTAKAIDQLESVTNFN